jgi:replicative DNA helicase
MVASSDDVRRRQQASAATRVPPHNVVAEESLLGAMLLSQDAIASALEVGLAADAFYKPAHGHIYDAITTLYGRGDPADPVTVAEHLTRAGQLEVIGGPATLISLQAGTPTIGNAARYARIVEEHALLRRLIRAGGDVVELGYSLPDDVGAAVDLAEATVFGVAQHRVTESGSSLHDILSRQLDQLELLEQQGGNHLTGIPTGYTELDKQLSGLQPSNLIIIGGRPGTGKTALAMGMAAHAATHAGTKVLVFSLEMTEAELGQRLLAAEARVNSAAIRDGKLSVSEWGRINAAVARLAEAPVFIDDNPHLTIMELRAKARRHQSREGLDLVVIDYLQLMTGTGENRQLEVAEVSRGLKLLARELRIPVVALSQLSRNTEQRADKRPMLADLRDSGGIEQDADTVIFVYRDELYYADSPDRGMAEINVAKQRSGPVGMSRLAFLPHPSFVNMASAGI